jgi:uncharacterized protein (DUF1501 family)
MNSPTFKTRREFLRSSVLGGALTWTVPSFIGATIDTLFADSDGALTQQPTGRDAPILVVLQLAGGNDGLNTLVPFRNDHYHRARPTLGLKDADLLRLNDDFALHGALDGMKSLYDRGWLSLVHGVGYPNPNRSHFRSTEIWQTATDADRVASQGWLGRYFDHACGGCDASAAVCIGGEAPQALMGERPHGIVFQNPQQYRLASSVTGGRGTPEEELFRRLNRLDQSGTDLNAGGSIGAVGGARIRRGDTAPLDFLERVALDAEVSSQRVRSLTGGPARGGYPANRLGRELEMVAKLILGGMGSRVYYVSHGGFDTHTNQRGSHDRLLQELGSALQSFCEDMQRTGNLQRVLVMTFSEFGRRVAENASSGTDHGAAAPLFIAGGSFKGGLFGRAPSLDPKDLDKGDVRHTVDFRSVYATVLERHLKAPSARILGRDFPVLSALG